MLVSGIQLSNYFYFEIWRGLVQVSWLVFPKNVVKLYDEVVDALLPKHFVKLCYHMLLEIVKFFCWSFSQSCETSLQRCYLKLCCRRMKLWNFVDLCMCLKSMEFGLIMCAKWCKTWFLKFVTWHTLSWPIFGLPN
jgi:hypothetical protein